MNNEMGDMPAEEFKKRGYELVDWIANYLSKPEDFPVLAQCKPGGIKNKLPQHPPQQSESFDEIIKDINEILIPGITHWNHPGFHAYFNSTGTGPGILAELLCGAFNINGMLWKSCPSATELEEVTLKWLREMIGLPENFWGIIYDSASTSTMHGIASAREFASQFEFQKKGMTGRPETKRLRLYASEHAHSSVDKGSLNIGLGLEGIKKIPTDDNFRMKADVLEKCIIDDLNNGWYPMCVVSTIGTTSTTSVDPLPEIGKICRKYNVWLHVDAAHAGTALILPEMKHYLQGIEYADSLVVNPHKWMGVPMDLSVFYTPRREVLKKAFSLVAEYLKTSEDSIVENYMDYGIQLGRRFRSLKLWFVIRYFGVEGLVVRLRDNIRVAKLFESWISSSDKYKIMAPVPFSTICFRAEPKNLNEERLNEFNLLFMNKINETGKLFLSHTVLSGKFVIRFVISSFRTQEEHVRESWNVINEVYKQIKPGE